MLGIRCPLTVSFCMWTSVHFVCVANLWGVFIICMIKMWWSDVKKKRKLSKSVGEAAMTCSGDSFNKSCYIDTYSLYTDISEKPWMYGNINHKGHTNMLGIKTRWVAVSMMTCSLPWSLTIKSICMKGAVISVFGVRWACSSVWRGDL